MKPGPLGIVGMIGSIVMGAVASGCNDDTKAESSGGLNAELQSKIEQFIDDELVRLNVPGIVFGVWAPEFGSWITARGKADVATGRLLKQIDAFRIASITKSYTATVVLQLIEEKKLGLEDNLEQYINGVPEGAKITIKHLLNHTSGLFTYTADETFTAKLLSEPTTFWTPQELVDLAIKHPANNQPGAAYAYSNTNYVLLGMIIEKLTANKVEAEIKARLFDRLNLEHTEFPSGSDIAGEHSHGYWPAQDGLQDLTDINASSHWTSGGIVSNADDMHIWVEALAEGTLLQPETQRLRLEFIPAQDDQTQYGLGVSRFAGFVGHDGTMPGFDSAAYYLPSRKASFVAFANSLGTEHPSKNVFKQAAKILFPSDCAW